MRGHRSAACAKADGVMGQPPVTSRGRQPEGRGREPLTRGKPQNLATPQPPHLENQCMGDEVSLNQLSRIWLLLFSFVLLFPSDLTVPCLVGVM